MHSDQLLAAVAQAVASLTVDVRDDRVLVMQKKTVRRMVDEGTKARFARAQVLLGPLSLGDVARKGEVEELASLPERAGADLDRQRATVFAPMMRLEGNDFPRA